MKYMYQHLEIVLYLIAPVSSRCVPEFTETQEEDSTVCWYSFDLIQFFIWNTIIYTKSLFISLYDDLYGTRATENKEKTLRSPRAEIKANV